MTRVGSFAQNQAMLGGLARQQLDLATAQVQVNTGKRSEDLRGMAGEATTLVSARSLRSRYESYEATARTVGVRLTAVDTQLSALVDSARALRESLLGAIANETGLSLPTLIDNHFRTAVSALNADLAGEYLFGGGRVSTPPVAVATLDDLQTLPDVTEAFRNDQLKPSARLADNLDIEHGQLASDLGVPLFAAFRDLADFNDGPDGPFGQRLSDAQRSFLEGQLASLDTVIQGLQTRQMENGLNQQRAEQLRIDMGERAVNLETFISEIEDVDIAEAISRLQADQTALEASYRVLGSLSQLSLARFL